jgi:preprotein translocase subunit SecG
MTSDLGTGAIFTDPRGGIGGSFNGSVQIPLTEFKGNSKTLTRFSEYRWSSSFWGK